MAKFRFFLVNTPTNFTATIKCGRYHFEFDEGEEKHLLPPMAGAQLEAESVNIIDMIMMVNERANLRYGLGVMFVPEKTPAEKGAEPKPKGRMEDYPGLDIIKRRRDAAGAAGAKLKKRATRRGKQRPAEVPVSQDV